MTLKKQHKIYLPLPYIQYTYISIKRHYNKKFTKNFKKLRNSKKQKIY